MSKISHTPRKANERLNQGINKQRVSGFVWEGHRFQTDTDSLVSMLLKSLQVTTGKQVNDIHWMTTDNTLHIFTPDNFIEFVVGATQYVENLRKAKWDFTSQ